jgi:putative aldouronate transport system permease protein
MNLSLEMTRRLQERQLRKVKRTKLLRLQINNWQLYLLALLPFAHLILFSYVPIYGVQIAFKDFRADLGIFGSPWVGFKHFIDFFKSYTFNRVLSNTWTIGITSLVFGFPVPIIFALMLNELTKARIKKTIQTISYAPYFISITVIASIVYMLLDSRVGPINNLIALLGGQRITFMSEPSMFVPIYVISGIWQTMGYSAVIYIAALAGVDPELHEAAIIDGASRLQKIRHIDLPGISPTIVILLILNAGQVLSHGFEKAYLLQNELNKEASEIISTYVYKIGLVQFKYSFSSAVGLFNSVINCILLVITNTIARRIGETSLF